MCDTNFPPVRLSCQPHYWTTIRDNTRYHLLWHTPTDAKDVIWPSFRSSHNLIIIFLKASERLDLRILTVSSDLTKYIRLTPTLVRSPLHRDIASQWFVAHTYRYLLAWLIRLECRRAARGRYMLRPSHLSNLLLQSPCVLLNDRKDC